MTEADTGPYRLDVVGPAARASAGKLPEAVAAALIELITGPLLANPHRVGKGLKRELEGTHAVRRGTFRVLYRIDDEHHPVTVVDVTHRGHAYRRR